MTDKLPPLSTPIVPPSQPIFTLPTVAPAHHVVHRQETEEEEPYTIKCICSFPDDDGNTIFCETCDTWQHIDCYYPENPNSDSLKELNHSCVDCNPRNLDRQRAEARQQARTTTTTAALIPVLEGETSDKKAKRPPSKNHKKKPKPNDLQLNGQENGAELSKNGGSHDHPPAKKAKTSHKTSQSISAPAPKRSPSYGGSTRVGQGHPPSPATTPPDLPDDVEIHSYSPGFLTLCNNQPAKLVGINNFVRLEVSNLMADWLRDDEKLKSQTGSDFKDVFKMMSPNIDSIKRPVKVQTGKRTISGSTVQWQYLEATTNIDRDTPLLELNGQIGFQSDYSRDPKNRYTELSAPLPFVQFHPLLPIYIDTRKEGSQARYVRRSCKPNADLETYLSPDLREYHFWLVSQRPIAAKEEITIPWDFRLPKTAKITRALSAHGLLGYGDEPASDSDLAIDETEYREFSDYVHRILSEHGGCACNQRTDCAFARFHRTHHPKNAARTNPPKKKARKPKAQHAISPTSTGPATNSRAPSEGRLEDGPDHDGRSVSGSSRSKPPSRDMTPVPAPRQGSFDTLGILTEPTDRDKRKVAMVEDSFRRLEQQQPPRKKKRLSDGPADPTTKPTKLKTAKSSSGTQTTPNGVPERRYVDAGTTRSKSGSPVSTVSSTFANALKDARSRGTSVPVVSRPTSVVPGSSNYRDVGVQTDPEIAGPWYNKPGGSPASTPKRRVLSLSQRLLSSRHKKTLFQIRTKPGPSSGVGDSSTAMDIDSPVDTKLLRSPSLSREVSKGTAATSPSPNGPIDSPMPDAPMVSPGSNKPQLSPPIPISQKGRSSDLRLQLPPVPTFSGPSPGPGTITTPLSAGGGSAFVQSPHSAIGVQTSFPPGVFGAHAAANPSPVKKKLSLSDYMKGRKNKGVSKPKTGTDTLRPSQAAANDEPKSASSAENNNAFSDSPTTADKAADGPLAAATTANAAATPSTTNSVKLE